VPVYRELVREFAVCDRWFASVPTSTQPNRMFVHSATSHGLVGNDKKMLRAGMPQRTIFDALHDAGHSFGIYYQFPPAVLFYRSVSFRQSYVVVSIYPTSMQTRTASAMFVVPIAFVFTIVNILVFFERVVLIFSFPDALYTNFGISLYNSDGNFFLTDGESLCFPEFL
jgi:hypothetical protein